MSRASEWNEHYVGGTLPWDTGVPDPELVDVIADLPVGRALEIGCGTGTNAVFLATRGFRVTAVDVAPRAVTLTRERAAAARVAIDTREHDILSAAVPGTFDFVFDRGVWHVFDEPAERNLFAARVASMLAPGGRWLTLSGSTEGAPREFGPPRRSASDLVSAIEPHLELLELRRVNFDPETAQIAAWRCLSGVRAFPAQPSTRHAR